MRKLCDRRHGRRRPARLVGSTFGDPERAGVTWQYTLHDGQFATERDEGDRIERFVIDYAFGSGHHATTFVSLTNRDPDQPDNPRAPADGVHS